MNIAHFPAAVAAVALASVPATANAQDFTPIDYPGSSRTEAWGIDGNNVVGWYVGPQPRPRGFLYDGADFTDLHYPGAELTEAYDISGSRIVGTYAHGPFQQYGFLYDGADWTTIAYPGDSVTYATGIDGNNIVGHFFFLDDPPGRSSSFVYDGADFTRLDYPGANWTQAHGISGNKVVGTYYDEAANRNRGFLYDGTTWTTLDVPSSTQSIAYGIDGDNIVGTYTDLWGQRRGFHYDGATWTDAFVPFNDSFVHAIDGDQIVGVYQSGIGTRRGFQMTVPEPHNFRELLFHFAGEVTAVDDDHGWFNGAFELGQAVDGSYNYFDGGYLTRAFFQEPGAAEYEFWDGPNQRALPMLPAGLTLASGEHEYESIPADPFEHILRIRVDNDSDGERSPPGDALSILAALAFPSHFNELECCAGLRIRLRLYDESGNALDTRDLPLTAPDLAAFNSAEGLLTIVNTSGGPHFAQVRFRIDSLTLVPEPAAGLLLIAGFGMIAVAARRRRSVQGRQPMPAAILLTTMAFPALFSTESAGSEWNVTSLHPAGATTSHASGVHNGQQVGYVQSDEGRASLWHGTAESSVDLHPPGAVYSEAYGVHNGQQVGYANLPPNLGWRRAGLWHGTAESWVNLHPAGATESYAVGVHNGQQVGGAYFDSFRAALWHGTAASWVNLHPVGATFSDALAVHNGQQVGAASFGNQIRASLWHGTAASHVNLHPPGATYSFASGVHNGQQVGAAEFDDGVERASLWHSTADSWVDLHPAGATSSSAAAVHNGWQVGWATFDDVVFRGGLWHGTAESWEELPLPQTGTWLWPTWRPAASIWSDETTIYVVGHGHNLDANRSEALLWTRPLATATLPGDFNGDGTVDAADYTRWRDTGGTAEQFAAWKQNFGTTSLGLGAGSGAAGYPLGASADPLSVAVPEPATSVLLAVVFGLIAAFPQRRLRTRCRQGIARFAFLLLLVAAIAPHAAANIYQWEYINPADPSQGKQQSTTLAPDGAGVNAAPGIDLSSRNLTMAYLIGANLTGANLTVATLTNADLSQANLTNAVIWWSTLTGANFTGAQVQGTTFGNPNLSDGHTNLSEAQLYSTASYQAQDLAGIYMSNMNLNGWNFSGQNLTGAWFVYGGPLDPAQTLIGANLTNANLTNASFVEATLTGADFTGAQVQGTHFNETNLTANQLYSTASYQAQDLTGIQLRSLNASGWNFAGQNLTDASFNVVTLTGADFRQANLTGAYLFGTLSEANFSQANLTNASLWSATLTGANFTGAHVEGANFGNSNLTASQLYSTASYQANSLSGIRLGSMNLSGWNFADQNLTDAVLGDHIGNANATLTNANFSQANLTNADFVWATLSGADFTGAVVQGVDFSGAGLTASQLYSTASYEVGNLTGIVLSMINLSGANFANQNLTRAVFGQTGPVFVPAVLTGADFSHANLTNADFQTTTLTDVNFTGAIVQGANFSFSTLSPSQLYSTASYHARDLVGIVFFQTDLSGWDFAGQNLMRANLFGPPMTGTNLSGADVRGAELNLDGAITANLIHPDGRIAGLSLVDGGTLVVRHYDGEDHWIPGPIPITIEQHMTMDASGTLRLVLEDDDWGSTISFEEEIPVTLGGTLELLFAADVDVASQVGRTFDLFDWTGVTPTGAFTVASPHLWNLANLYTTGEATLLAATALPGDFNNDGTVDAADYTRWRDTAGTAEQFADWKQHFGTTSPGAGSGEALPSADPLSAPVPEPTTGALLAIALTVFGATRLRRTQPRSTRRESHTFPRLGPGS